MNAMQCDVLENIGKIVYIMDDIDDITTLTILMNFRNNLKGLTKFKMLMILKMLLIAFRSDNIIFTQLKLFVI